MLLHIFIAIIFGGLIFKPPKVKGDSSLLPALGGLLDPLSSTNPIDTLTSFNMLSSSGFSNLLGLSKLPNLTDFLKEISSLMPNATLCKMCQMNSVSNLYNIWFDPVILLNFHVCLCISG